MALLIPLHQRSLLYRKILTGDSGKTIKMFLFFFKKRKKTLALIAWIVPQLNNFLGAKLRKFSMASQFKTAL